MKLIFAGMLAVTLTACSSWPDPSKGGGVENYYPGNSYEDKRFDKTTRLPRATEVEFLGSRLENSRTRLDLLIFEGAIDYFPAAVHDASVQHQRALRAYAGEMYYDAHVDEILLGKQLAELERRMTAIGLHPKPYPWDELQVAQAEPEPEDPFDLLAKQLFLRGFTIKRHSESQITIYPLAGGTFASGSAEVNDALAAMLTDLTHFLENYPHVGLDVSGHTDAIGEDDKNSELSKQRAMAVANYLYEAGLNTDRITSEWHGEQKPLVDNTSEHNKQLNRRVELTLRWE